MNPHRIAHVGQHERVKAKCLRQASGDRNDAQLDQPQGDEDDEIVERPDAKDAPRVEGPDVDATEAALLNEQEVGDEEPAQDEEERDRIPRHARPVVSEGLETEAPHAHVDVEDDDNEGGDRTHAVEPPEVDRSADGSRF